MNWKLRRHERKKRLCRHQTASGAPRLALKGEVESHVDDHQICSTHESSLGRDGSMTFEGMRSLPWITGAK